MTKQYPDAETVSLPGQPDHNRLQIQRTEPVFENAVDTAYTLKDIEDEDSLGSFGESFPPVSDIEVSLLDKAVLSDLLFYTFGRVGTVVTETIPHGPLLLKTSPAHGSLHPLEAYPIICGVEGVPDGRYHYSVEDHSLDRLGSLSPLAQDILPTTGGVLIGITAVVKRCMWKYRGARELRNILHDFGHLIGTYDLVTEALGIDSWMHLKFDTETLAKVIDINIFEEPPIGILTAVSDTTTGSA